MSTVTGKRSSKKKTAKPRYFTNHSRHAEGHYILNTNDPELLNILKDMRMGDGPRFILGKDEMVMIGRLPGD